jgi:proliferating cell nuclear antigen
MSKLLKATTEHCLEFKIMFDVLKDVIHECKMDFIRDKDQCNNSDDSDSDSNFNDSDSNKNSGSDSDNESVESSNNKKNKNNKKKITKINKSNKKKDSGSDSDELSNSDSENTKHKKNNKINTKIDKNDADKKQSTGGIKILELDEHQTLLIYVKLNASQFSEFYVKYPTYSVGLDLSQLHKFLKTIDKDSVLNMYVDKDDEQNIVFQAKNDIKQTKSMYTQKLMDLDDASKKLPKQTNFEILVTIETAEFHKLCREMNQFSDYIEITCTGKEIVFKCQGDSNSYVKKFSNSDKGVKISCLDKGKKSVIVQAIYELRYLVTFGKCVNLCQDMQLYLRNDYPIFIHYTIAILGKMLIGLTPVDEKSLGKGGDYNEQNDKFYESNKKPVLKST